MCVHGCARNSAAQVAACKAFTYYLVIRNWSSSLFTDLPCHFLTLSSRRLFAIQFLYEDNNRNKMSRKVKLLTCFDRRRLTFAIPDEVPKEDTQLVMLEALIIKQRREKYTYGIISKFKNRLDKQWSNEEIVYD